MYADWIFASGWSGLYAQGYKFEGYASTAQLAAKANKATTLAGYGITDAATKTSLAPEYSPSSAYAVGAFVYHDGNIYQCKTAIADGGEAWNAAHWELRKLDDFFTDSNSLLVSTIAAKLPYPINTAGTILDRNINVVTSGEFVIPEGFKDLLIRYTGVPASLTFSGADVSIADWGDDLPTESGDYLITVTRIAASECYIRIIQLKERA